MDHASDAFAANRLAWDERAKLHVGSRFYDVDGFVAGADPLDAVVTGLLGDVHGKHLLHLQCHFGQDTLALARRGAIVTGLDISGTALDEARKLAARCGSEAQWVQSNVIDHRPELDGRFDVVFTSYGTIAWLPDLEPWAANIVRYLKPGGRLVFVEFHPAVWMFDNDFTHVAYSYFNTGRIVEEEQGSYADRSAGKLTSITWNHALGETLGALLGAGLRIMHFSEHDGSPFDCFANTVRSDDGRYRIKGMEGKLPMVYALVAERPPVNTAL